jgi:molybdopterin-guanine dinucleotide biosynthesis protein A
MPGGPEVQTDAAGFVLAGGRSSRMGLDKALVEFHGQPLVSHALHILNAAGLSASIAGARSRLESFAPVVQDAEPDRGPLGGICAALASTACRYAIFLPVDLPLLPPELLTRLLDTARLSGGAAVMASLGGFAQTFPAVVDRVVLPHLRSELEAGRGGCFSALQSAATRLGGSLVLLPAESLTLSDPVCCAHPSADVWFSNLNSPADVERAQASSAGGIA